MSELWRELGKNENEITTVMHRGFIEAGARNYDTLEDWRKGELELRIPEGLPVDYYAGVITTTRMVMEWIPSFLEIRIYGPPISMINSRVCLVISRMKDSDIDKFIELTNSLSI